MSLQRRVFLLFLLLTFGLIVIVLLTGRIILASGFEQLENDALRQNVFRVSRALQDQASILFTQTADYAVWDDSYAFLRDGAVEYAYVDVNFPIETFENLGINFVAMLDTDGAVIFARMADLEVGEFLDIPPDLQALLTAESPLFALEQPNQGILSLAETPLLFVAHPVLTSTRQGPSVGALIMGRLMNDAFIATLSSALDLPLALLPPTAPELSERNPNFGAMQEAGIVPVDNMTLIAYQPMNDVNGTLVAVLRLTQPRDILQRGQASVLLSVGVVVFAALVYGGAALLAVQRVVVQRLLRLSSNVEHIRSSGDVAERVTLVGTDELGALGGNINHMLESLENAQNALRANDQRLRLFVNSAPILMWAVDKSGTVTLFEGLSVGLLGLRRKQAIGQPLHTVFSDIPQFVTDSRQALEGKTFASSVQVSDFAFDAFYAPAYSEDQRVVGAICVAVDVSQRMKAEQTASDLKGSLQRHREQINRMHGLFESALGYMDEHVQGRINVRELAEYITFLRKQYAGIEKVW